MSRKLIKKRERGANYTLQEKEMLVDIITQYIDVVEDKGTAGSILNKKKEAWNAITIKYNSNCTTGPRQTNQLKVLYDNMKQNSRKQVGESNKHKYINRLSTSTQHEAVTKDDLAKALRHLKEEKEQIHTTGDGSWKSMVTDSDTETIQDQIDPLSSSYDSEAEYSKETPVDLNYRDTDISCPLKEGTEIHTTAQDQWDPDGNLVKRPTRVITSTRQKTKEDVARVQKTSKKPKSVEALKRIYFRKKCENAYLERKKLMQEILNNKSEHNLKMMILKKKLEKISY